jgi:hypothetical protein
VPGTLAVAFSCVALRAVPYVIAAGVAQLIVGVARMIERVNGGDVTEG